MLNFLYDVLLHAFAGVDVDLGPLGSVGGQIDVGPVSVGPGSFNILDLNSDSLGGTIDLPPPLDAFSVNFAWPNITTNGTFPPNPVTSSGASNNFLELNLDLDQLVSHLLFGGVNPLDPPRIDLGPIFVDFDLLDVDITGGLNFLQDFAMQMGDLTGILHFENGSSQSFTIGDSLLIDHASAIDAGGDGDGLVEFDFTLVPTATLHNETDLGMNIGASVSVLSVEVGYDIGVASDSTTIGPLASFGGTAPVGSINVFDDTFDLHFAQQHAFFLA
jgi:hypothetical protein